MPTNESEIELLARAMIDRHGADAARAAVLRLNQLIDSHDWEGRDRWACVVREIHDRQGRGGIFPRDKQPATPRNPSSNRLV